MKYIRTKDENNLIIDLTNMLLPYNLTDEFIDFNQFGMFKIVKQADTIEELCDEFVFEDSDGPYLCDFCEHTDADVGSKFDELMYWFNHSKEEQYKIRNCYGAIWTEWGLKYVAKMKGVLPNGEIDWELL